MTSQWLRDRPGLLVSVRDSEEAESVLHAGADLIDIKEPSRGSLGRADPEILASIVARIGGRCPLSAALGELGDGPISVSPGIALVKVGLAGWAKKNSPAWPDRLVASLASVTCDRAAVVYADSRRAMAPALHEVVEFAIRNSWPALLIDTWEKDGTTLLDWIQVAELAQVRETLARAGIALALAGSLGRTQITELRILRPDWFAVRGSVCHMAREGRIDPDRVRRLKDLLESTS